MSEQIRPKLNYARYAIADRSCGQFGQNNIFYNLYLFFRLVAFHAPLDYLSQYQLKEVFLRRAKIFANKFAELDKLTLSDKIKVGG